jgi:hypothetical protein
MAKLNLTKIAAAVNDTYEDVETPHGTIRVYHVPDALRWGVKPTWGPPVVPTVEMTLAGNNKQRRAIKETDPGYAEYLAEVKRYEQEASDLEWQARFIFALRDVPFDDVDLGKPPPNVTQYVNGQYPPPSPHDILRKFFWLTTTILVRRSDLNLVAAALDRMNTGVTPGNVDTVKKSSASTTEADSLASAEVAG